MLTLKNLGIAVVVLVTLAVTGMALLVGLGAVSLPETVAVEWGEAPAMQRLPVEPVEPVKFTGPVAVEWGEAPAMEQMSPVEPMDAVAVSTPTRKALNWDSSLAPGA